MGLRGALPDKTRLLSLRGRTEGSNEISIDKDSEEEDDEEEERVGGNRQVRGGGGMVLWTPHPPFCQSQSDGRTDGRTRCKIALWRKSRLCSGAPMTTTSWRGRNVGIGDLWDGQANLKGVISRVPNLEIALFSSLGYLRGEIRRFGNPDSDPITIHLFARCAALAAEGGA